MKKLTIIFALSLLPLWVLAQAPADSCINATDLGMLPYCETQVYSNTNATSGDSVNIINGCSADTLQDIWFSFVPADTAVNYRFDMLPEVAGSPISNATVAIYTGDCQTTGLTAIYCFEQTDTSAISEEIRNLLPGTRYYFRVASPDSTAGDFSLCIEPRSDIYNIDEGFSTACEGTLFDDGGPENDYSANRMDIFTICPESPNACIEFTLIDYELEYKMPEGDRILFYNGPDTMSPLLLNSNDLNTDAGVPEGVYGGTGLNVKADSNCLTIVFISDGETEFEGFRGEWTCTEDDCMSVDSMTYAINPGDDQIGSQLSTPYTDVKFSFLNCPDSAYSIFNTLPGSTFPIRKGVLLTNGRALDGIGSNDSIVRSTIWGSPGVPMLDSLSILEYGTSERTMDGCELEVTVFAQTDELFMDYVLASEEYQERVTGDKNDLAGVFISGEMIAPDPNIAPFNQLSTLPDPPNTPVQIFTVNQQDKYSYYHPNAGGTEITYDGLVTDSLNYRMALTARTMVKPCNTYTFRMSVADRDTGDYDTGLFFSDIRAALPSITGPARIIENCPTGNEFVVIQANKPAMDTIKFYITLGGSAEEGVDYIFDIPRPIVFAPGEQQRSFPIEAIVDGVIEPTEQISMTLSVDYGCGQVEVGSLEITLIDEPYVEIQAPDTVIACFGEVELFASGNTQEYRWEPQDAVDDFRMQGVNVSVDQSQWLSVRAFTPGIPCERFDSVYVLVVSPSGDAAVDRNQICIGDMVTLTATNISGDGFRWEPAGAVADPNALMTNAMPSRSTTYQLIVEERGCEFEADVFVQVDSLPDLSILTDPDESPYCKGSTINLSTPPFIRTNYPGLQTNWQNYDPAIFVGDPGPGVLNPSILIDEPVTLVRTALNGACRDTQSLVIDVIDPVLTLNATDTLICPDEEFTLIATVSNGTFGNISYTYETSSNDVIIEGTGSEVTVSKTGPGTAIITVTINADGCERTAEFTLSVPNLLIDLDAMPDVVVGEGEEVTIDGTVRPDTIHSVVGYEWCRNDIDLGVNALQLIDRVLLDSQVYTLKVTDDRGCVFTKDITIIGVPPEYEVPNVFSPNDDGNNDEFGVVFKTGMYEVGSMVIFNRWGQKVFDGSGNQRWNGMHEGKPAVMDVYAYIIELVRPSGDIIFLKGDVTLVR